MQSSRCFKTAERPNSAALFSSLDRCTIGRRKLCFFGVRGIASRIFSLTQAYRRGSLSIEVGVSVTAKRGQGRLLTFFPALLRIPLLAMLISPFAAGQQVVDDAPPDGAAIFAGKCSMCHGDKGQGIAAAVTIAGPSLQAEHEVGRVMTAVESGPSHMPAFSRVLSVPQIRAVSYYVSTQIAVIPLTGGDISEGGNLFRVYCATCHRTAVRGGALAFAGRNAPALTNKSAALVAGAIRWGPGTMPSFPPGVLDDRQLASVVQYVEFVQHPPDPGGNPLKYYGPVSEGFAGAAALLMLVAVAVWIERGGKG